MAGSSAHVFIDPTYAVFSGDRLFDLGDVLLNRDDQLLPFHRLREALRATGKVVHTADLLSTKAQSEDGPFEYFSLGILDNYKRLETEGRAALKAFVFMEPPVVAPHMYRALPELTRAFEKVYLPNVQGDGYDLAGVRQDRLHKFHWPLPFPEVLPQFWSNVDRQRRLVVINGSHRPRSRNREQYSTRIEAMAELAPLGCIDLYGRGWGRWASREAFWLPYWLNRNTLLSIYKGACDSKYDVLSQYEFCLCFENMQMDGYITEKIFDCFYAGAVPVYMGAPDVTTAIPAESFVDGRDYESWTDLWRDLQSMPETRTRRYRDAAREFLAGGQSHPFHNSLVDVFQGK